jgi:hypothetical protein
MVIDELFAPERLQLWIDHGSPAGRPNIATETYEPNVATAF